MQRLVEQGVDQRRLEAIGYGSDVPVDSNRTAEGRAHNRRIEFHIVQVAGETLH